jgi:hypothetical protein
MGYTYREGRASLSVTGCDEHYGGILLTMASAPKKAAISMCIEADDLEDVISEMRGYSQAPAQRGSAT